MSGDARDLLAAVRRYYSEKVVEHGATALGVDWNSEQTQALRFAQLEKLLRAPIADDEGPPVTTLADLGCGYGGMLLHLRASGSNLEYTGIDISPEMIETARRVHADTRGCRFFVGREVPEPADFVVASGIFNVRPDTSDAEWRAHVLATVAHMWENARRGIAFNCLTTWSDRDRMRPHLHYADPASLLEHCRKLSRHVALLHDYGLYEFTLIVRR